MTKIFISGSRSQVTLPDDVKESINNIMRNGFGILLGDCNQGVDSLVADMLAEAEYPNVSIYTVLNKTRINTGNWCVEYVKPKWGQNYKMRQTEKDKAMSEAADYGLCIFNPTYVYRDNLCVSSGTLRNAVHMLLVGTPVKLFYLYEEEMKYANLKNIDDLEKVLLSYKHEYLSRQEMDRLIPCNNINDKSRLVKQKSDKILKKFRSIVWQTEYTVA